MERGRLPVKELGIGRLVIEESAECYLLIAVAPGWLSRLLSLARFYLRLWQCKQFEKVTVSPCPMSRYPRLGLSEMGPYVG